MEQVRACDFCGTDATGVYEPYPPSVPDGPRVLLCDACRDRLAGIVEPLVARIEGPGVDDPAQGPPDSAASEAEVVDGGSGAATTPDETPVDESAADQSASLDGTREAGGRPVGDRGGTPPGYRKVMRFLENRELPIDREAAERLAAEAYDLDAESVADIIDHAVGHGRLRLVGDELKR